MIGRLLDHIQSIGQENMGFGLLCLVLIFHFYILYLHFFDYIATRSEVFEAIVEVPNPMHLV